MATEVVLFLKGSCIGKIFLEIRGRKNTAHVKSVFFAFYSNTCQQLSNNCMIHY